MWVLVTVIKGHFQLCGNVFAIFLHSVSCIQWPESPWRLTNLADREKHPEEWTFPALHSIVGKYCLSISWCSLYIGPLNFASWRTKKRIQWKMNPLNMHRVIKIYKMFNLLKYSIILYRKHKLIAWMNCTLFCFALEL